MTSPGQLKTKLIHTGLVFVTVLATLTLLSFIHPKPVLAASIPAWSAPSLVDETIPANATAVSCISNTFCMAVDANGNAISYNGTAWSPYGEIDNMNYFDAIDCTSDSFCVAVDNYGHALIFNGSGWSAPADIDGNITLSSVACDSSTFCVAVDSNGNALTYNGSSWSTPVSIDGTNWFSSVSCSSSTFCGAVDYNGDALTYNGTTWSTPTNIANSIYLNSVSCLSDTFCEAVDYSGYAISYSLVAAILPSSPGGSANSSNNNPIKAPDTGYGIVPTTNPWAMLGIYSLVFGSVLAIAWRLKKV